eukprot:1946640-Rhodomonas_salina.4
MSVHTCERFAIRHGTGNNQRSLSVRSPSPHILDAASTSACSHKSGLTSPGPSYPVLQVQSKVVTVVLGFSHSALTCGPSKVTSRQTVPAHPER